MLRILVVSTRGEATSAKGIIIGEIPVCMHVATYGNFSLVSSHTQHNKHQATKEQQRAVYDTISALASGPNGNPVGKPHASGGLPPHLRRGVEHLSHCLTHMDHI